MNKKNISHVIGEGTYGCVHKPSLTCKKKRVNYDNKISKVMKTKEAVIELNEYKNIAKVDEDEQFYLGTPTKCKLDINERNVYSMEKCKNSGDFFENIEKMSLLVMEDGGKTIEEFADKMQKMEATKENKAKIERFWIEAHRILRGLKVFLDNGIVHHDLKPQNIFYNEHTNRLNFIDFGLMTSKEHIIKKTRKSDYYMAKYHWSYPFEIRFMNKKKYMNFAKQSEKEKQQYYYDIISGFRANEDVSSTKSMKTFFYFISKTHMARREHEILMNLFFEDFYHMLVHELNDKDNYTVFVDKCINTIDIYGTGISFFYMLSRSLHLMPSPMIGELSELFYYMVTPDINKRYNIEMVLTRYEMILKNAGILDKYNLHFENHEIMDGVSIPQGISHAIQSVKRSDLSITKQERDLVVLTDITPCPAGKEYKKATRRCVKICKDGFERNADFKCVKNMKNKTAKTRS